MTTHIHLALLDSGIWTSVNGYGTTGSKPSASAANLGYLYYDTTLTQLQRSNGTTWDVLLTAGAATWGSITGTLSSQTDLNTALAGKQDSDAGLTSLAALTGAGYIKATATDTYSIIATIPYSDLSGVPSTFTPAAHVLDSATHTISGKTAGQALIATAATTYAFTTIGGDATLNGSGTLTIAAAAVTLAKMANLAANSVIGNNTGSAATPVALTQTQLTAMVNTFTSTLSGAVSASGGGTSNFLRADGSWTTPVGTFSGSIAANQVAIGSGANALSGSASLTATTTSGALLLAHASGTSTATTATNAASHTITFSGAATTGPMTALSSTTTSTGTIATAGIVVAGAVLSLAANPGGAVSSVNYTGSQSAVTTTSAANTNFANATIYGHRDLPTFSNAAISGTTLAALVGSQVSPSIVMAPASGGATITAVYGVWVKPGTFSTATTGTTTTVTNYYGLYLDTVTTTGSGTTTLTNRYGIYQADSAASNTFAGAITAAAISCTTLTASGDIAANSRKFGAAAFATASAITSNSTTQSYVEFKTSTPSVLGYMGFGSTANLFVVLDSTGSAAANFAVGTTALVGSERLRVAGGTAPGTPAASDVLVGSGSIATGATVRIGGQTPTALTIKRIDATNETGMDFQCGAGTATNWKLATNVTVAGAIEFSSSTTVGGTTYDSPTLILSRAAPGASGATEVRIGAGKIYAGDTSATSIQTAGGITAAKNSFFTNAGTTALVTIGSNTASSSSAIQMNGTGAVTNWLMGVQYNASGIWELTPSTAAGGSTFSNPAIYVSDSAPGTPASTQIRIGQGAMKLGATTASSSTATGALTVAGGVGWALDAFGGGKIVSVSPTGGIGYATGAGGTVTQATSRATGVTLNKVSGQITLFSAAGSTSWQSFDVTNSTVATTDTISLSQVSGTDQYLLHVVRVNAGSFRIAFATNGGTTVEQPVIQFNVIKGATA